jgi:hypothetical protein
MRLVGRFASVLALLLAGCGTDQPKTKLIYFGFDNHEEKPDDVLRLAKTWGSNPACPQWRATIKREEADYQVLFGAADVTITDRRGQVLYSGGTGVLYMPNGNPDGSGVNICKLTGG